MNARYTCIAWSSFYGLLGVLLFLASAAVMAPVSQPSDEDSGGRAHAHLYMKLQLFGVGFVSDVLRVDVFHYLLAAAVTALAVPLVQMTRISQA